MRSFTYDGSDELATQTRLETFNLAEAAYRGEVGTGGFDFDDETAASELVGLKDFTAEDDDSTPARFFTGRLAERGIGRGPYKTDANRQWQVSTADLNSLLDDVLLRSADANRPAETDVARVTWLLSATDDPLPGVGGAYIDSGNTTSMAAQDYRSSHAREVLDECMEQAGKNGYLFDEGSGPELFYDLPTSTARMATGSISNVFGEADGSTIFAPAWGDFPALSRDPTRVYSGVEVQYGAGSKVFVTDPGTEAAFRQRETSLFNSAAKTSAQATVIANQFLEAAATEEDTVECPLVLPSDKLGLYLAGQVVSTNFEHLGGTKNYLIVRKTVEPWESSRVVYLVTLSLMIPVKITRFGGRGSASTGAGAAPCIEEKDSVTPSGSFIPGAVYVLHFGTMLWCNAAWTAAPCGIGGGAWTCNRDQDRYYTFTAPGLASGYVYGLVTIGAMNTTGTAASHGIEVRLLAGTPGAFGEGTPIGRITSAGGGPFLVPLSNLAAGGTNSLILHPDWLSARIDPGDYVCVEPTFALSFLSGQGDSGTFEVPSDPTIYWYGFCDGAGGVAPWVSSPDPVDGSNATFTLVGWDGQGIPEVHWNGLGVESADLTLDTATKTATLAEVPPVGTLLLWQYSVAA